MPSNIILKKSSVVNKVPLVTDLQFGELALNYADSKLYFKKADGTTVDSFTTSSVTGVTGTAPVISSGGTAPAISISAATTSAAGSMSAADKTKLDGIAAGATNVTNTNQLTNGAGYITSSGTAANVTGTVAIANGGTGATTAAAARTNLGATTLGGNLFTLTNVAAISFPRFNADNTVSSLDAAAFRTAIGAGTSSTTGTVTSVGGTGTVSGLTLSGTVTGSGNLTLGGTLAVTASNFASQTANTVLVAPNGTAGVPTFRALVAADIPTLNQNTTGTAANVSGTVAIANGGTGATTAAAALTNLGAYAATNPSGYTSNTGTVTSVGGTGTVSGLTLTGTVTTSGNLTLGGTLSLTSGQVTTALGYTPYNSTNPSGYITSSASITGASRRIEFVDGPRNLTDRLPNTLARSVNWDFVGAGTGNGTGNYAGVMSFTPWDGTSASTGDSSYQLAFANQSGVNASGPARLSIRNGINTTWNAWQEILTSSNFTSYSPGLTGTGASGSWGISVTGSSASTTGNAATATALQTARTINGVSFNGTANINIATKLTILSRAATSVDVAIANALLSIVNRAGSTINVAVS